MPSPWNWHHRRKRASRYRARLASPLSAFEPVKEALLRHADRAEKLRRQGLMTQQVTVFLTTGRFDTSGPHYARSVASRLPFPTDYTPTLIALAVRLLASAYRPGCASRNAGSC